MMTPNTVAVLFLCTGNSARSIMAEAILNAVGQPQFSAYSAGSFPTGKVNPKSIETLKRHGLDPGVPRSKSWNEFSDQQMDVVVTVCDQAAGETCPFFPGRPRTLHWSIPDPAHVTGTQEEINAAFDNAFHLLKTRIEKELLI
ncbi:MAG: protein-tyrosine-phosphatase [Nitrospirales bacterium]|nr:MAG: protein-tyrosine-phosphatase [Nitrospirales bacterium]